MPTKIMTIVGTRPELIKLSRVIAELDKRVDHILVHTGQNFDYELNEVFFQDLAIRRPDYFLEAAGETPAQAVAKVIVGAEQVIRRSRPDAVLLLGDTNSCLAAYAAKREKVPIFHMEAGNRCFDERVPEEINRKLVDRLSDINLTYTEHARRYLLAEGFRPETVLKTGSPMGEVLSHYRPQIDASSILRQLDLRAGEFFLVSAHREENVDSDAQFRQLVTALNSLAEEFARPIVFSVHPRTRKRLDAGGADPLHADIHLMKPLGFFDYVHMQMNSLCVLSDSGTITEEASLLGFPAVMLREAHERPEGMDEGTVVMAGVAPQRVIEAVRLVTSQGNVEARRTRVVDDYASPNVSLKVVRIILSYIDYINRTVWLR
jgi:UDP-N-acetylglucosamine 2-epimerase (non-hydrolysing)